MRTILRNARVMTCDPARGPGLGIIERGAVVIGDDGNIEWVGDTDDAPPFTNEITPGLDDDDLEGLLVTPGLVDCHTHAIFEGDRAREFALRAAGKSYVDIQAAGGGIMATLGPTRAASTQSLQHTVFNFVGDALVGGTTTLEVKSGYDLTFEGEMRLLEIIASTDLTVPTLLAHLVPPERQADRDAFVREICTRWVPGALGLAKSVDVWIESTAFTVAEARKIFEAARAHGLPVRGHVGQLSDIGGAELLAEFGALSADHLEYVGDAGIAALARAGTVAVMLPGACVQLRLPVPPVEKLRAAGVAMAIATDLNPGSSYCETLPIQMWLATTHYGMTVEEAWLGVTRHAAKALAIDHTGAGVLRAGGPADLVIWLARDEAEIPYRYATSLVDKVYTKRALTAID